MDVTQISVKINQTPLPKESSSSVQDKSETVLNSFDQILSMFSSSGQTTQESAMDKKDAGTTNLKLMDDDKEKEPSSHDLDTDDWQELDSLLTSILAGIQSSPSLANLVNQDTTSTTLNPSIETAFSKMDGATSNVSQLILNKLGAGDGTYNGQEIQAAMKQLLAALKQTQGGSTAALQVDSSAVKGSQPLSEGSLSPKLQKELIDKLNEVIELFKPDSADKTDSNKGLKVGNGIHLIKVAIKPDSVSSASPLGSEKATPATNNALGNNTANMNLIKHSLQPDSANSTSPLGSEKATPATNNALGNNATNMNLIKHSLQPDSANSTSPLDSEKTGSIQALSLDKHQINQPIIQNQDQRAVNNTATQAPASSQEKGDASPVNLAINLVSSNQESANLTGSSSAEPAVIPVSDFVPEITNWMSRMANSSMNHAEAKFSLYPEHLGPIEIKIASQDGQITAQILTDNSAAKDALNDQLQHLKQAIEQHGIVVQKLDIVQQPAISMGDASQSAFSQNGSGSQRQRLYDGDQDLGKKQKGFDLNETIIESLPTSYGGMPPSSSTIDFTA
ncbi:flagellar hook-length control protein FliK [Pullulanibacillus sp. KACC 23026]|uniref:flagellar hook-length control protein FliK n=1 Tax=Pullulanibacillus sp. KACC 23026 TaxID=3028315 RepID=UPI0023AF3CC4|nr:flagellar hook-length control protein FliK [Pullulanibacillus sp. KACC 23026]WEG11267.1 flagellar hook-length control protein FliK [Pullulanibacillus sp. KACC 23026]